MKKNKSYDAMGQRIAKKVTNKNTTDGTDKFVTTYYVRDPQGNVLAVYEHKHGDSDNGTFTLAEQHLYGAGRLGMRKRDLALNATNTSETPATYYELTNHLGNVMAVISDEASTTDEPTVVSLSDCYPYGMTESGRSYDAYRYGFNSQENVPELGEGHTTALYWEYDGRLGRRWNLDPISKEYESNYSVLGNSPLYAIDVYGADSTLFGENGAILCQISNDNGATSEYFVLRTTQSTDEMYSGIQLNEPSLRGWTSPISKEDADRATFNALTHNTLSSKIEWDLFVHIPNKETYDMAFNALSSHEGFDGYVNIEYSWQWRSDRNDEGEVVGRHVVDISSSGKLDPNASSQISVPSASDHSHPSNMKDWMQPPSSRDIQNLRDSWLIDETRMQQSGGHAPDAYRRVWGMGNETLYIINQNGVVASVPFRIYLR